MQEPTRMICAACGMVIFREAAAQHATTCPKRPREPKQTTIPTIAENPRPERIPGLFDDTRPAVRSTDPDTSKIAERSIRGSLGRIQLEVLHFVAGTGSRGATSEEVCDSVGSGRWKRLSELNEAGMICATGDRRPASTGRIQIVWRVTEQGEQLLRHMDY